MVKYRHHSSGNQLLIETTLFHVLPAMSWFTATIFLPVGHPIDIIVKNKDLKNFFSYGY